MSDSRNEWEEFKSDDDDYVPLVLNEEEEDDNDTPNEEMRTLTPLDIFTMYFNDQVIEEIVIRTNTYASEKIDSMEEYFRIKKSSRYKKWKPTNSKEIRTYLGLIIIFGIHSNICIQDNWSTRDFLSTDFRKAMSYDKFTLIAAFIHLESESEAETENDSMKKLRFLIDNFNRVSPICYKLSQKLSIDENLYPCKARVKFRQYMKSKPNKYGLKVFLLAAAKSGYCYKIYFYTGKSENGLYKTKDIVWHLIEDFNVIGHCIYADNWFTTLDLVKELTDQQIGYIGTLRKNRVQDKNLKSLKVKKHEYKFYKNTTNENIMLTYYHDRSLVKTLSNCVEPELDEDKPKAVSLYNKNVRGVDLSNFYCSTYRYNHRCKKWWKRGFYYLIELALTNSFIIYKHFNPKTKHREFVFRIALDLINL
jgi:hypothetical protein